jgi:RecT family
MTVPMKAPPASLGVLRPSSIAELDIFSQRAASSGMVPPQYAGKPGAIFIAVQYGSELGLSPMQSLTCIAVVNNRATIFGDAMPGLVRQSPVCEDIKEWFEGEGDSLTAWCEAKRRGASPVRQSFSVSDAKKAGLWGKAGPWTQYPKRMLQWRSRSWALRDAFPDVLRGLIAYEEAIDIPRGEHQPWTGPTIEGQTSPEVSPPNLRDAINEAVPMPPKRTARQWLDELRLRVAHCQTSAALDAIATSEEIRKAQGHLRNGALQELNEILADAMERLANAGEVEAVDEAFPGDP